MGKIAFLFAGQGAQYPGMGRDLYEKSELAKKIIDRADEIRPGTRMQLLDESFAELNETKNTQVCMFLMDYIAARLLMEDGIKPQALAGFSLGELAALTVSGTFDLEDAIRLVSKRGEYMQECGDKNPGKMAAVMRPNLEELSILCKEYGVYMANISSSAQVSVSGARERMDSFMKALSDKGIRYVEIAVSGAFHTPYMAEAGKKLYEELKTIKVEAPKIPVYANLTGCEYPSDAEEIRTMLSGQVSGSVLFKDVLENMSREGIDNYIECGPGKTLAGFVKKTVTGFVSSVGNMDGVMSAVERYGGLDE